MDIVEKFVGENLFNINKTVANNVGLGKFTGWTVNELSQPQFMQQSAEIRCFTRLNYTYEQTGKNYSTCALSLLTLFLALWLRFTSTSVTKCSFTSTLFWNLKLWKKVSCFPFFSLSLLVVLVLLCTPQSLQGALDLFVCPPLPLHNRVHVGGAHSWSPMADQGGGRGGAHMKKRDDQLHSTTIL